MTTKKLDVDKFKRILLEERIRLEHERHENAADEATRSTELSDYDNHPADSATETYERTKDLALDENFRNILEQINDALHKIDEGTYGVCDRCNQPISKERLKALPYATLCIECQEIVERR